MSLDASGKPVVVARPASAKPGSSVPSKIKTSSSTSHSVPGSKPKGSASGNRSTAGSQRPGSAKPPSRGRLAPLSNPSGLKTAQSILVCSGSVPAFRRFVPDDLNALKQHVVPALPASGKAGLKAQLVCVKAAQFHDTSCIRATAEKHSVWQQAIDSSHRLVLGSWWKLQHELRGQKLQ